MCILIRTSGCTRRLHSSRLKLMQPRLLWLEHRPTFSAALRRKGLSTGLKSSLHPTSAVPLRAARVYTTLPPRGPLRGVPLLCSSARALSLTPVAFASSSASTPTADGSVKTETPTVVPLRDVKRIMRLAYPQRWRLAGKPEGVKRSSLGASVVNKNGFSLLKCYNEVDIFNCEVFLDLIDGG